MNPLIKTPKEILLEKAGVPKLFKKGGKTSPKNTSVEDMKHYLMIAKSRMQKNADKS